MRSAIVSSPGQCAVVERPEPSPKAGEALVAVRAVGLCGSDLASYTGANPLVQYPIVIGHELCGQVLEVGAGVDNIQSGHRVTVNPVLNCGYCPTCRSGHVNCCETSRTLGVHVDGGASERIVLPADKLYRAPDDLSDEEVALIEPVCVAYHAVRNRAQVCADDWVVVIGAGAIGLGAVQAARIQGARVAALDIKPAALERAEALGAETLILGDADPVEAVRRWTDGRMATAIIEAAGSARTVALAVDLAAHRARIAMIGYTAQPLQFETPKVFNMKELTLMGCRNSLRVFPQVMAHAARGALRLSPLISHRFPMDRAPEAFACWQEHPGKVCKIVLTIS